LEQNYTATAPVGVRVRFKVRFMVMLRLELYSNHNQLANPNACHPNP